MHAVAFISQSALNHNLSLVKALAPKAKIVSIVKANAYGHQLDLIAPLIEGADMLGVSGLAEAAQLRKQTNAPILLLSGVYTDEELSCAIKLNCHIVIHSPSQIELINNTKQASNIWLKLDTGMHRLGLSKQEYQKCLPMFSTNPLVNIACVMSHFACADEPNHPTNKAQLDTFNALTDNSLARSMANSAAILSNTKATFEFVRPGIMLYGVSPFSPANTTPKLSPVMQLTAPILSVKTIPFGASVGYGGSWVADKKTTIAIIAIGYADGYPYHAKSGTPVLIGNTLCPLLGQVSMDFICVDVSHINPKIGSQATLWGTEKLAVETVAKYSDTIPWTLLSGVSSRVEFVQAI